MTTIKGTGQQPIRFEGEAIATGNDRVQGDNRANRWTEVVIYKTKAGKYIIERDHKTCWDGEKARKEVHVCEIGVQVVVLLRGEDGSYGEAEQEALEKAAEVDDAIRDSWVVEVA